jgi:tRNA(fMet)-specific endonuclease VapC
MTSTPVFINNCSQAIRPATALRSPDGVKQFINVIKQRPLSALQVFNQDFGHTPISDITLAGLPYGAKKSNLPERSLAAGDDFWSRPKVLHSGLKAAQRYAKIRRALEKGGQTAGIHGLHIADHACSKGLTLVSNNSLEFEWVDGLQLNNWHETTHC